MPRTMKGYLDRTETYLQEKLLPFWMDRILEPRHGGFRTAYDRDGNLLEGEGLLVFLCLDHEAFGDLVEVLPQKVFRLQPCECVVVALLHGSGEMVDQIGVITCEVGPGQDVVVSLRVRYGLFLNETETGVRKSVLL